jgi:hypothetical protein
MINDLSDSKWAVMVCIDVEEDDWIFVTEDSKGNCWDLRPVLFDDINEAMAYAGTFSLPGKEENVMVVNYDEKAS